MSNPLFGFIVPLFVTLVMIGLFWPVGLVLLVLLARHWRRLYRANRRQLREETDMRGHDAILAMVRR